MTPQSPRSRPGVVSPLLGMLAVALVTAAVSALAAALAVVAATVF